MLPRRHPELVSGSISTQGLSVFAAQWTLKQVQGDELFFGSYLALHA
jgi:hypothetical protein